MARSRNEWVEEATRLGMSNAQNAGFQALTNWIRRKGDLDAFDPPTAESERKRLGDRYGKPKTSPSTQTSTPTGLGDDAFVAGLSVSSSLSRSDINRTRQIAVDRGLVSPRDADKLGHAGIVNLLQSDKTGTQPPPPGDPPPGDTGTPPPPPGPAPRFTDLIGLGTSGVFDENEAANMNALFSDPNSQYVFQQIINLGTREEQIAGVKSALAQADPQHVAQLRATQVEQAGGDPFEDLLSQSQGPPPPEPAAVAEEPPPPPAEDPNTQVAKDRFAAVQEGGGDAFQDFLEQGARVSRGETVQTGEEYVPPPPPGDDGTQPPPPGDDDAFVAGFGISPPSRSDVNRTRQIAIDRGLVSPRDADLLGHAGIVNLLQGDTGTQLPGDDGTQPPPPGDDGTQPPPPGDDGTQPPPPGDTGTQPPPPGDEEEGEPPLPPEDVGILPQEDKRVETLAREAFDEGGMDGFLSFMEEHVASAPLFERSVRSGFEDLIANRVSALQYDRDAVVAEGEAEIDRSFQDAALELARFANLEPGGTDSGKVIDRMERLLSSREQAKSQLKIRAREMEFEAADKAIARMTETANAFFGQDVTRAGLTGSFRGETTVQENQRKIENEARVTEMFGGTPPTMMSINEFRNAMNAVEGDVNYRDEFDIDGDGQIGFTDWLEVSTNGVVMPDGRIAYGAGPRTIAGQQLDTQASQFADSFGLDKEKFVEANKQFNDSLSQNMDQFMSSSIGQIVHMGSDGNLVFDVNPATGEPLTALEKIKFEEDMDQFNRSFAESVRQFDDSLGFSKRELASREKIANKQIKAGQVSGFSNMFAQGFGAYMHYKATKT